MTGLIQVELFADEVLSSYVSRLARANFRPSALRFCKELGLDIREIYNGRPDAAVALAGLVGKSTGTLQHHATTLGENHDVDLLGEAFSKPETLKNRLRFCPACFAADNADEGRIPGTRRYRRAQWYVTEYRTCAVHGCALIERGTHPSLADFCTLVDEIPEDVMTEFKRITSSPVEGFIYDRMHGVRKHGDLLDEVRACVAIDVSRHIGIALVFGKDRPFRSLSDSERRDGLNEGFSALAAGSEGFLQALEVILKQPSSRRLAGLLRYGNLNALFHTQRDREHYGRFRELLLRHAAEKMPLRLGIGEAR